MLYILDANPYGGPIRPHPFVETEYHISNPGEYTFLEYEFTQRCLYLVFGVKAKTDAIITLSPSNGLENNIYEISKCSNHFFLFQYKDIDCFSGEE